MSSRASCIAVGCYSGSYNGHCGCHMCSPIKIVSRVLKKTKTRNLPEA